MKRSSLRLLIAVSGAFCLAAFARPARAESARDQARGLAAGLPVAPVPSAGEAAPAIVEPPARFSRAQIAAWIDEARLAAGSRMEFELYDTATWAEYVNYHHFVSVVYEGLPADYKFDYSWPAGMDKKTRRATIRLPQAEIIETGKFIMWWNSCNFYELSEEECRANVRTAVLHEGRHFVQWQGIAREAIAAAAGAAPAREPMDIADFSAVPGAVERFMAKWADGPHYQCREVEVYSAQINGGEMALPADRAKPRLQGLAAYVRGCAASHWKDDFAPHLKAAEAILAAHGVSLLEDK